MRIDSGKAAVVRSGSRGCELVRLPHLSLLSYQSRTVSDLSGAVIPGAKVELTDTTKGYDYTEGGALT